MSSSLLLSIITFVYGLASVFYIASWAFKKPILDRFGAWITVIGVAGNTAGIILRWIESYDIPGYGHAPLSNLYESLVFFALTIAVVHLVIEKKYQLRIVGVFASPLAFLVIAYASLSPNISDRIQPLMPALKSNWLIAHVIACFLGYAPFAISFGVSVIYLFMHKNTERKNRLVSDSMRPGMLEELNQQLIMFGFLFLTIGIITGAVWANSAWGRYWGWDPKETWSLITWFIYATVLHARMMRGWGGGRIAWFSIVGFAAVLFTYFGVNYLPGLHSYGSM